MNSIELQKNFHTVYKSFFNAHDVVLSGDAIMTWWADISHGISTLRVKQKLPIKTFCWVNFNASGKVTFGTISQYSILKNIFEEDGLGAFFKHDTDGIARFLEDFLTENGFSGGMEIDFLAEAPRWHGFAFSWAVSVLLTFLLHIATGRLDMKILVDREMPINHHYFDSLYEFSLQLSHCISKGKSTGASNYAVMMVDNTLPAICLSRKNIVSPADNGCIASDQHSNPPRLANTVIYKDTLSNFLWMNGTLIRELPLDYGVVFTGMEYTFSEIESTMEQARKRNDRLDIFITQIIQSLPIGDEDRTVLSDLLKFDKNEVSRKNIDNTNLKILEWFDHLFKNMHDDNAVSAFIDIIKKIGLTSFSYQKENKLFFALVYLFHKYRQFEDEEIGVLPFNTGKIGGSLMFVMKSGKSRTTIWKVLEHLRNEGYIVSMDYASWRDGYSSDGVRLEQYITQKLYSDYTKEGDILFADTRGISYFGDYDAVIENERDCILLDTIRGRIYIKGIKLTSKEIHSQNTTIDMMKILLENIGKEVSNSKLPVSTYSQNKNEILSKVVLPIRKLAKEHFWEEISLFCSGGITDYYLRLERDTPVRIGIIRKLQG